MKTFKQFIIALPLLLLASCAQNNEASMSKETVAPQNQNQEDLEQNRQIIKTGRLEFETDNLEATYRNTLKVVDRFAGITVTDNLYEYKDKSTMTIEIRVPQANFDTLLNTIIKDVPDVDFKTVNARDVTLQFIDVQARLKTKKALEQRYLELLNQTETISEILEIEAQANFLRTEIESMEGQLNYLKDQVTYSTLTVEFYKVEPKPIGFGNKFKKGLKSGWQNLMWFFVFLTQIWPFILILTILLVVIKKSKKRRKSTGTKQ